jgi:hypothetical protein
VDGTYGSGIVGRKEELQCMVAELPEGIEIVAAALLHVVGEVQAQVHLKSMPNNSCTMPPTVRLLK